MFLVCSFAPVDSRTFRTRCLGQVPQTVTQTRARPRERTQDEGAAKQRHSSGTETTHRATGVAIHRQAACCCLRVGGNATAAVTVQVKVSKQGDSY